MLAFYGDDFTGSTDALEFLARAGAKTVLFIEPPTAEQLQRYPGINAFGVAGSTRALPPAQMEQILQPAFEQLQKTGARHVHYKVCSTFDSSPHVGSIGRAIEVGATVFKQAFVPVLVAAPVLGRYSLFGNLFARMGIGSNGSIHRLDRHPSMSRHPVTPADESDLRLHLQKQTHKKMGLIDILQLAAPTATIQSNIDYLVGQACEVIFFDALYQEQLYGIGEVIDERANASTLFSVGSSGIEMALGQYWNKNNILQPVQQWAHPGKAAPLLVLCGSCSPVTANQILYAKSIGFKELLINTAAICNKEEQALQNEIDMAVSWLREGHNLIVHTGGATQRQTASLPADVLGTALGRIAKKVIAQTGIQRLVIAGGDTSSYAGRALGIEAVEVITPLSPGAPLCKATAPGSPADGLEVNFKGGQVGGDNYFEVLLNGIL